MGYYKAKSLCDKSFKIKMTIFLHFPWPSLLFFYLGAVFTEKFDDQNFLL